MSLRLLTLYNELSVKNFEKNDDDDLYDKCSRKFSTIMMLVFSFILSTAQFVGEPIRCWCPNEFTLARCDYATTSCYINSQYIPITNGTHIPSKDQLLSHKIIYYQWVIYIFFLQALVFYIPCLVW
jgi:innexin